MDLGLFLLHLLFIGGFAGGFFAAGYMFAMKKFQNLKKNFRDQE